MSKLLACAAAILAFTQAAPVPKPTVRMQADVDRLAARASQMDRLWPWKMADREIDPVARHGTAVAPLLVAFLAEDPHEPPEEMADLRVQQHAALALCRIYKVSEQCGHVYCNRETREGNKAVRRFWVEKTSQDTKPPQGARYAAGGARRGKPASHRSVDYQVSEGWRSVVSRVGKARHVPISRAG